jgi:hypothetical protein
VKPKHYESDQSICDDCRIKAVGMFVGEVWAWIKRDGREEWLIVDDKCVANVTYAGGTYTYFDEVGNRHTSKSFRAMVVNAVKVYNVLCVNQNRKRIKL